MLRVCVLPGFLLLGGCAGSLVGDMIAGPEALAARDDKYCRSIGFQFGTPEYGNCRLTVSGQRDAAHQATLDSMGPLEAPRRSRQCVSRRIGSAVYTDCD